MPWRRLGRLLSIASAATLVVLIGTTGSNPFPDTTTTSVRSGSAHWEPYSGERLESLRAEGRPVFVNFTAAWCITCLVNEKVVLGTDAIQAELRDKAIVYMKGDWTNRDPEITRVLELYGRSGVPLYLLFPSDPQRDVSVLPNILTKGIVLDALAQI